MRVEHGDCLEVMPRLLAEGVQVDAIVCDPPYHLTSIVKRFGKPGSAEAQHGTDGLYARASRGFMGKEWDGGDIAFRVETWAAAYALLKPGGHLIAFSGTRTYHRMACAIEDAGFEIRDQIGWLYGSGFPKSHDVSKGIDRAADYRLQAAVRRAAVAAVEAAGLTLPGNSRHDWTVGEHAPGDKWWAEFQTWIPDLTDAERERVEGAIVATISKTAGWFTRGDIYNLTAPATPEAAVWQGWGTALKPAWEPIVLARKPLVGTVATNVLAHGTGALNIDGCRIGTEGGTKGCDAGPSKGILGNGLNGSFGKPVDGLGRWPANVIHDGSDEVVGAFPSSKDGVAGKRTGQGGEFLGSLPAYDHEWGGYGGEGSAARFFYSAKADADDRLGSKHPTVKPTDLMAYLCRLVTPPGGTVLDPFAGSGSTGMACLREGFNSILIEREDEYVADIKRRIAHVSGFNTPLFQGEAA